MEHTNPFTLPKNEYVRDLNILKTYIEDTATYVSLMSGKPLNVCIEYVKTQVRPGGKFEFKDPKIVYLEREENGDRFKKEGTLARYLQDSIKDKELISPTLTTYLNPNVKQSLLVNYIDANVNARKVAKKAMFKARMNLDKVLEAIKDNEQTNKKLANNAISGAHVSPSTPLYNKTAHSTLTSNCRTTSGYGNANNEKFLCGNRHYWAPDIVKNNIISIKNHSDYVLIEKAMTEFGIRAPTIFETMECITYSTNLYWRDEKQLAQIHMLVTRLTDLERAAFVYTGDLYHLMKYNDEVVRRFIASLSSRKDAIVADPDTVIEKAFEDHLHLAAQLCPQETKGKRVDELKGTHANHILAATILNVDKTIQDYSNLIKAFWVTENVPASVAYFPESIRRAAITGDTDSTIFTVQDWVIWYSGRLGFDDVSCGVAATMIFLAAQTITHVLARISANFGIEEKRIHQVAMKNEYKFDVFIPTQVAKHYYALISCQEGNVYAEYKKEIKGVHLKSSNAPKEIMDMAKNMMEQIMLTVVREEKISIVDILNQVAAVEHNVLGTVNRGSHEFFRSAQVKDAESYTKSAEESNYAQYTMWNEVFSEKYGAIPPPPYMCVKISTDLKSPAKTRDWLAAIEDRDVATKLETWMAKTNKKYVGTFLLPEQILASNGIPKEVLDAVDVRKIVFDASGVFYILLESLGIFMSNKKQTHLVSDYH